MAEATPHSPDEIEGFHSMDPKQQRVEMFFEKHDRIHDDPDKAGLARVEALNNVERANTFADIQLDLEHDESFSVEAAARIAESILILDGAVRHGGSEVKLSGARAESIYRAINDVQDSPLSEAQKSVLYDAIDNALVEAVGVDVANEIVNGDGPTLNEFVNNIDKERIDAGFDSESTTEPETEAKPEDEEDIKIRVHLGDPAEPTEGEESVEHDEEDAETERSTEDITEDIDRLVEEALAAAEADDVKRYNKLIKQIRAVFKELKAHDDYDADGAAAHLGVVERMLSGVELEGAKSLKIEGIESDTDDTETETGPWDWKASGLHELAKGAVARGDLDNFNEIKQRFIEEMMKQFEAGNIDRDEMMRITNEFSGEIGKLDKLKEAEHIKMGDIAPEEVLDPTVDPETGLPIEFVRAGELLTEEFNLIKQDYNRTSAKMRRTLGSLMRPNVAKDHRGNEAKYNEALAKVREHIRLSFEQYGTLDSPAGRAEMTRMLNAGTVSEFESNAGAQIENMKGTAFGRYLDKYSKTSTSRKLLVSAGLVGAGFLTGGIGIAAGVAGIRGFTSIMSGAGSEKSVSQDKEVLARNLGAVRRGRADTYENITNQITGMSERRIGRDKNRARIAALGGVAIGTGGFGLAGAAGDFAGDRIGDTWDSVSDWASEGGDGGSNAGTTVESAPNGHFQFGDLGFDSGPEAAADAAVEAGAEAGDYVDIAEAGDGWTDTIMDLTEDEGIEGVDAGEAYQAYMDNEVGEAGKIGFSDLPESYDMGNGDYGISSPGEVTIPSELRAELVNDLQGYADAVPAGEAADAAADTADTVPDTTVEAAPEATVDVPPNSVENPNGIGFTNEVSPLEDVGDVFGDYMKSQHPDISLTDAQVDVMWDEIVNSNGWSPEAVQSIAPGSNAEGIFGAAGDSGITNRGISGIESYLSDQELVS